MQSDQPNTTDDEAEAQRRFEAGVPMPVAPTPRKETEMIGVTPEMLKAGLVAFCADCMSPLDSDRETVERIYRAMRALEPTA